MSRLIERGRHQGVFRSDVAASWLAAVMRALMHAAEEIVTERMTPEEAPALLATTVRSAFTSTQFTR